jgi:hypothetical protein
MFRCGETTYSDVSTEKVETFLDHLPHRFPPNLANLKQSKNKKFCTAVADAIVAGNYGREELVGKVHPTVSGILASKYHWDTEELEISLLVTKVGPGFFKKHLNLLIFSLEADRKVQHQKLLLTNRQQQQLIWTIMMMPSSRIRRLQFPLL